jgi:hypothetical protein
LVDDILCVLLLSLWVISLIDYDSIIRKLRPKAELTSLNLCHKLLNINDI